MTLHNRFFITSVALALALSFAGDAGAEQVAPRNRKQAPARAKLRPAGHPIGGAPRRPVNPRWRQKSAPWQQTAVAHRGHNGRRISVVCPPGGALATVWGSSTYTDDSSVCSAAVHAGYILIARGGRVTIQIRRGRRSYRATHRNGVSTRGYGTWTGSFVVLGAVPGPRVARKAAGTPLIGWHDTAVTLRGRNGARFTFRCPRRGALAIVWGASLYTDDSSICSAATHDGRISQHAGGRVTIEIRRGEPKYAGRAKNGVTTRGYGAWTGSFVFVP